MARPALLLLVALGCGCGDGAPADGVDADEASVPLLETGGTDATDASTDAASDAPRPVCDARTFGAKGDGKTKDTKALQAAIDACSPGNVVLRDGTFLTGMLRLRSDLVLSIEKTATLKGTQDDADYPSTSPPTSNTQLLNCRKALLYAEGVHDLTLEGGGTIDGNGNTPKWIGPSKVHPEATRPMAIYTVLSRNVTIHHLKVVNAAMWGVVSLEDDDLSIHDLVVDTPLSGNRDGIDVVDCHRVRIENVTITSEDDSICLKSGVDRGVHDVVVKNARVKSFIANALKMGTASYGAFANVTFEDVTVESADKAAMAVESVDGAAISNIVFRRITFKDVGSPFFVILGDRGSTPLGSVRRVGTVNGVRFEDIVGTSTRHTWGSPISGTKTKDGVVHPLQNLAFTNVVVTSKGGLGKVPGDPPEYAGQYPDPNLWGDLPAYNYFLRHVDGVTFTGSSTKTSSADARKAMETRDVTGLVVK